MLKHFMASVMGLTFSTIASAQECDGHINIRSLSYDIEEGASLTMQIGEKTWQVFTAQSLPMAAVEDQQDLIPTLGLPSVIAEIKKDLQIVQDDSDFYFQEYLNYQFEGVYRPIVQGFIMDSHVNNAGHYDQSVVILLNKEGTNITPVPVPRDAQDIFPVFNAEGLYMTTEDEMALDIVLKAAAGLMVNAYQLVEGGNLVQIQGLPEAPRLCVP